MNVLAISGSLRTHSLNTALLRAATELAPAELTIEIATFRDIPLYDGDVEAEHGSPEAVRVLKDRIAAADGLLFATPEYNASIPGVAKNAIDWLSRPSSDIPRVFGGKPLAMLGATPGPGGTIASQTAWLPIFRALGVAVWAGPRMYFSGAGKLFDQEGVLVDEAARKRIGEFMGGFAKHLGARG